MSLSLSSSGNTEVSKKETAELLASYMEDIKRQYAVPDVKWEKERGGRDSERLKKLLASAYASEEIEKQEKEVKQRRKEVPFATRFHATVNDLLPQDSGRAYSCSVGVAISATVAAAVAQEVFQAPPEAVAVILHGGLTFAAAVGAAKITDVILGMKKETEAGRKNEEKYDVCRKQLDFLKQLKKEIKQEKSAQEKAAKKGLMASLTSTMKQAGTAEKKQIMPAVAVKNLQTQR